jgi:hypothetical protein
MRKRIFGVGGGGGVSSARTINTTAPLTGGGDLSADRTFAIPQATGAIDGYLAAGDFTTFNNKISPSPSLDQTIQPTADKTFIVKQFNGTNAVDIFEVKLKDGTTVLAVDKDGNTVFGGTGAGSTQWTTGALAVGAASSVKCGANTGNVFACSENGGAVQNVLLANRANTFGTTGTLDASAATSADAVRVPNIAGAAPTLVGAIADDTTQKAFAMFTNGTVGYTPKVLLSMFCNSTACTAASPSLTFTTGTFTNNCISGGADTNCTNAGTNETAFGFNATFPANTIFTNKLYRVDIVVERTSTSTVPTFLFKMKLAGTIIFQSNTQVPGASTVAIGRGTSFLIQGTAAAGASAAIETGTLTEQGSATATTLFSPNNTAQPVTGFATNGTLQLTFTLQLGTGTIGNFVRLRQVVITEMF